MSFPAPLAADPASEPPHLLIGEAAALTGIPPSRLRSWERAGLLCPARVSGGLRLYAPDDVARARLIARSLDNPGRRGSLRRLAARLGQGDLQPEPGDYAGLDHAPDIGPDPTAIGERDATERFLDGVAWRTVVDAVPDLIAVSDHDGRLAYANPALRAFWQRDQEDGTPSRSASGDATAAATLFGAGDLSLRWTARTRTPQHGARVVLRGPDGGERHTLWNVDPLPGDGAAPWGAVAVGRDVTAEHVQARTREDWLAVAAHDLRTPVTAILGHLQLARRTFAALSREAAAAPPRPGTPAPAGPAGAGVHPGASDHLPRLARNLEQAETATQELLRLMQSLLDASAAAAGQLVGQLDPDGVELGALARDAVDQIRARTTRHVPSVALPPEPVVVTGDRGRLRQVLANLLANAVKYAPDGGPIGVRLEVAAALPEPLAAGGTEAARRWALLQVEDAGLGIPAADVPHVFDRYRRATGAAQLVQGAGLGLYLCRAVVAAHGGHIWVERTAVAGEGGGDGRGDDWHGTVMAVALPLPPPALVSGSGIGGTARRAPDGEDRR